ncbi:MarR family winged helix-turn-helix transcriptional regulator [Streptomyces sp. NPDC002870]|uniref:MarR family winged helix-turn-helix transcriptional regulator n=1 Tax=Streptomyces sp. NPDC002870 TaxID=3364666 RepID=UPI0036B3696E
MRDEPSAVPAKPGSATLLNDQFCFTVYAASRAVTGAYRPLLEGAGLTYPQYLVMLALWRNRSAAVKDLVSALQLDYGTVTPLIKRLEANGLIKRQRRADDERIVEVVLTPQGYAMREDLSTVPNSIGAAMGLTDEEFATAQGLLRKLTDNITGSSGLGGN